MTNFKKTGNCVMINGALYHEMLPVKQGVKLVKYTLITIFELQRSLDISKKDLKKLKSKLELDEYDNDNFDYVGGCSCNDCMRELARKRRVLASRKKKNKEAKSKKIFYNQILKDLDDTEKAILKIERDYSDELSDSY